jgi:hypothetical protein
MEQSSNTLSHGKEIPDFLWKHDSLPHSQQVVIPSPVPNKSSPHHPFPFSLSSILLFPPNFQVVLSLQDFLLKFRASKQN